MASKTILGIDIGSDNLKLTLVDNGIVTDAVSVKMPENLFREGRTTSVETLSELIAKTVKENGIKARDAAVVLPNESVYIKTVRMPMMTTDQLVLNLPYEFNDYITGEIKDYVFDYAVLPDDTKEAEPEGDEASDGEKADDTAEETLNLMAVGAERALIEEYTEILRRAGLNMVKTAPAISAYISLLRRQMNNLTQYTDEFCILDLGFEATRMYMFKRDRHEATRVIEVGMASIERVIADACGVESHLAHTYLLNNFENCLEREECHEACDNIAVELMRALNFYRFSNPDSALTDMWLCGGGAVVQPLYEAIGSMLEMRLHTASELVPDGEELPECNIFVQAAGITFDI